MTYRLNEETMTIGGKLDGMDALRQSIFCILRTERLEYIIYSDDYGVELMDRFGQPLAFTQLEIQETVTEALTQDDRIEYVTDFEFTETKRGLLTRFTVRTTEGDLMDVEWEAKGDG